MSESAKRAESIFKAPNLVNTVGEGSNRAESFAQGTLAVSESRARAESFTKTN